MSPDGPRAWPVIGRVPPAWLVALALVPVGLLGMSAALPDKASAPEPAAAPPAPPRQVVVSQATSGGGPAQLLVTWSRSDPSATGYEVLRDGAVIGDVPVRGETWDDLAFRDPAVEPGRSYQYQVRARTGTHRSPLSASTPARPRGDGDVGGRVFEVDSYLGTDLARAQAAVNAATAAGGGVVQFGPRVHVFSGPLRITGDRVVLRGAGTDATVLQTGFAGTAEPCETPTPLLEFKGTRTPVSARLAAPVAVGDRQVPFADATGLAVGQVLVFDQRHPQNDPSWFAQRGITQDPGTGNDRRYNWDANEIIAVDGGSATFRFPFAQPFTTDVVPQMISQGLDNAVESLTVQGRGPDETTFHRLIDANFQARFTVGDVRSRWANRNDVRARGYDIDIVGFQSPDGGPAGFDTGQCKYRISVQEAANVTVIGGVFGEPGHDRNQDFVVSQWAQRVLVRHNRFYGSRTMAINEHGGGSSFHIYENNYLATGPNSKAAIFLGNTVWGFGGPAIIRNNRFEGNQRDLMMLDHPFEVRFLDNVSVGCTVQCILWSGWGGTKNEYAPIADPRFWGSARLTVAGNVMRKANVGVHLGYPYAKNYPYMGIKDVVVRDNVLESSAYAIRMFGSATTTARYQVSGNSGSKKYQHPPFGVGVYWADNADGKTYGLPTQPAWTSDRFAWQEDGLVTG